MSHSKIYKLFRDICIPDNAKKAHNIVIRELKKRGYKCKREFFVDDRGDGYTGRIDIYAEKNDDVLLIEIDCRRPRKKSLFKIRSFEYGDKIVLLRSLGGVFYYMEDDVHVIGLEVI